MKYLKCIGLIVIAVMLASCGSSGGGGGDLASGSSSITIAIGGSGVASIVEQKEDTLFAKVKEFFSIFTPSEAVAGWIVPDCDVVIPLDVISIEISITGSGIDSPITELIELSPSGGADHCESIIRTYTVPNGSNRVFRAIATGLNGREHSNGTTIKDINGADFVQIIMDKSCDLFVDDQGWDVTEGPDNDCMSRDDPCKSITHAMNRSNEGYSFNGVLGDVICVAEGWYNEVATQESFPLNPKPLTTLRCEGPNHSSIIDRFGLPNGRALSHTIINGSEGFSIEGCRIVMSNNEVGIDDNGSNITVDNCLVVGGSVEWVNYDNTDTLGDPTFYEYSSLGSTGIMVGGNSTIKNSEIWYNEIGIDVIGGDPNINNNHLSCNGRGEGGIDLKINNRSEIALNARNNAWDNIPVFIETQCTYDGTDICIFAGVEPDTSGARLAEDGCPNEPYYEPLWITPLSATVVGYSGDTVTFSAGGGVPPYTWSNTGYGGRLGFDGLDDTQVRWHESYDYCDETGTATVTVTDSIDSSETAIINIPTEDC